MGLKGLAAALLLAPLSAQSRSYDYNSTEINQQSAAGYASNNFWNGSGDSKDEGVRNGMRAMNRLASLDIGGAIHYGYKGYGNYTNSQKMDDLDARVWKNKGKMDSIKDGMIGGAASSGAGTGSESYSAIGPEREGAKLPNTGSSKTVNGESVVTSKKWSAMDRGFLYRGETAEVAAEFERKSGMSREEFFNQLADTADASLNYDDPNLMNKLEARYAKFVNAIPNKEYRANIQKAYSMFSFAKKQEALQEVAAFYYKMRGDTGPSEPAQPQVAKSEVKADLPSAPAAVASERSPSSADNSNLALAHEAAVRMNENSKLTKEQMGMYLGLEGSHGDELKDIMIAADTDSIFRKVSKRYRKLTPALLGKAIMLDSR
jgi:hypothetical protein